MTKNLYISFAFIIAIMVCSCEDYQLLRHNSRMREVRFSLGEHTTRVVLVPSTNSGDLIAKWSSDDKIRVILSHENQTYDMGEVPVRNISDDGKSGVFQYALPEELDGAEYYELSCFTSSCEAKISEGEIFYRANIERRPINSFYAPVMFSQIVTDENTFGYFQHYGTYELLHISNISDQEITFSLNGFNPGSGARWFREVGAIRLFGREYVVDTAYERHDKSPTISIPAHSSDIIISWYIPNGAKINDATMVAEINGENVYSTNTINSNVTLCTGFAYHMYATWDGTELKFDKVNDLLDELGLGFKHLELEEDSGYGFVTGREGHLSFDTTDPSVATAIETDDIGDPHVDILSHSIGTAIITITDTNTGEKSQIEVVVTEGLHFGITVEVGETECVTMKNENGNYEAYSEKENIATCEVSGNKIYVTGVMNGETTIHVTETGTDKQYTISVKVYGGIPVIPVEDESFTVNGVTFNMKAVEGGTFWMGSPDDDPDAKDTEKPRHQVTLNSFAIGETEVTQALWKAVMGNNPSHYIGEKRPVEEVSWEDCQEFISKLNALTGRSFRLPTEAEWEFAARGGNISKGFLFAGSNSVDEVAWYNDNSEQSTHNVGTKKANELGIFDMSGNVWEWCQDWYDADYYQVSPTDNPTGPSSASPSYRAYRGGGFLEKARDCRLCRRTGATMWSVNNDMGLRLALSGGGGAAPVAYKNCPDDNHPHMIDLGLPSGTLWACCNVGATTPEGYGGFYAWGETQPKDYYWWSTYLLCDGSYETCYDIGTDITGTQYDAATANWGLPWQMPTWSQFEELIDNCITTLTTQNGIVGCKFAGPSGGTIFLPAAGYSWYDGVGSIGNAGYYWSSTLDGPNPGGPFWLYFMNDWPIRNTGARACGHSVRPVKNSGSRSNKK